nr:MAG TPA: hypothetical protein [Caudoviricetes sp.]
MVLVKICWLKISWVLLFNLEYKRISITNSISNNLKKKN